MLGRGLGSMLIRIVFFCDCCNDCCSNYSPFRLPTAFSRGTDSHAGGASAATPLGRLALSRSGEQDEQSGVLPLLDGPDAFVARIALIRAAEVAVDVQYYIWQRDATGLLLLDELRKAAERGGAGPPSA